MGILKIVLKNVNFQFCMSNIVKKLGIPIFCTKMIEYFGNSYVFFTLATKKVRNFLAFPNEKCG